MSLSDDLRAHLKGRPAPLLFVGSGLARRYADTDDWDGLLRRFAAKTPTPYARYLAAADTDRPKTASAIADQFFDVWWDQDEYEPSRLAFPDPPSRESPFKIEVANYFKDAATRLPDSGALAQEIDDLRVASARGIAAVVTTNYDQVTDSLFPGFSVFRSQDELLMSTPYGGRELFKIHGCCTVPDTMVLTASDFDGFEARSPYLAAKLLILLTEHPVIFLGYSIDDPHIRRLLIDVARALSAASVAKLEGNLIFVRRVHSGAPSAMVSSSFTIDGTNIPMLFAQVRNEEYGQVFEALKQLRPKLPTKVVAQLKSEVYRIIDSDNPNEEIYVRDIESLDDEVIANQLEVVVGVGIRDKLGALGFVGINREHLLDDLIEPDPKLRGEKAAREVLETVIPPIQLPVYVPVFKYLARAGFLDELGHMKADAPVNDRIRTRVSQYENRLKPYAAAGRRPKKLAEEHQTVAALRANAQPRETLEALMCLDRSTIDRSELLGLLVEQRHEHPTEMASTLARAICLYDYIVYGPGAFVPTTQV